MAGYNPFKAFRKHQKIALAVVGVGAMVSFIILPAILQLFSGGWSTGPQLVAKTRQFGNVDYQTMDTLRRNHQALGQLYFALNQNLVKADMSNWMDLMGLARKVNQYQMMTDDEALVTNWLLAKYAASQGIAVDDQTIVEYLNELCAGHLTTQALADILKALGLSEKRMKALIADELLVTQLRIPFELSQNAATPAKRWDWFQRMYRQVTTEVAAVSVDAFVDQISNPNDSQLRKFFEENKDKVFNPFSPEIGFKVPHQLAFQYVKAVPGEELLASISQEEIEKFYEENKLMMFRKPVEPLGGTRPIFPGAGGRQTLPGMDGNIFRPNLGGFTPGGTPDLTPFTMPETPSNPPAVPETSDPDASKPAETPNNPATENENKTDAPTTPSDGTSSDGTSLDGTSLKSRQAVTRFVAFQTESEVQEPKAEEPKTDEPKADAKPTEEKAEEPKADAKPAEEKAEEPKADAKPAEEKIEEPKADAKPAEEKVEEPNADAKPAEEKVEKPKADAKPAEKTETEDGQKTDISSLFKPLSEVEDDIRKILAWRKVEERLDLIEDKMRDYFHVYNEHLGSEKAVPSMPDLSGFVKEQGLELVSAPFGDFYGAMKTDLARGLREREYLRDEIFRRPPPQFEPSIFDGDDGKVLFWVTEIKEEHTPEKFEDARDTVLARWKEVQARPLAMKKAQELVSEAKASGKSLAETFATQNNVSVVETEPFTWWTYGHGIDPSLAAFREGANVQLDFVREKGVAVGNAEIDNKTIFAAGSDFMETTYGLQIGEVAAAFNQPQTMVYIVRVTRSTPSEDALWSMFQTANFYVYASPSMQTERGRAYRVWLEKIQEETGFQWVQKP